MTLSDATARAVRAVLGRQLDEFRAARAAFRAGELAAEQFEPVKRDFTNALDRRQDIIAGEVKALMAARAATPCAVRIRRVTDDGLLDITPCPHPADTVIAGRHYCPRHAATAPRLPVPVKGAAA